MPPPPVCKCEEHAALVHIATDDSTADVVLIFSCQKCGGLSQKVQKNVKR